MPAVARQIAEDLVTILNAGSFSQPFTAIRAKRPNYSLQDAATLRVVVTHRGVETEPGNRKADHHDHLTEVAIFKLINSVDNADTDPMDDLVQEIADALRRAPLATADAAYKRLTYDTLTDEDELEENNLYFALVSIVHRSTR